MKAHELAMLLMTHKNAEVDIAVCPHGQPRLLSFANTVQDGVLFKEPENKIIAINGSNRDHGSWLICGQEAPVVPVVDDKETN